MPDINKEKILGSPKKTLIREYNNLKKNYSRIGASKYKTLYESQSLSFILENSDYIFTEPSYGLEFYKSIIKNNSMPFSLFENECGKVNIYVSKKYDDMSSNQKALYKELAEFMESEYQSRAYTCAMYDMYIENGSADYMMPYYDALYEYSRTESDYSMFKLEDLFESASNSNIYDLMNIGLDVPEFHPNLLTYLESMYVEKPEVPYDYTLNSFTTNSIKRMLKDSYMREKVDNITNVNLYHTIKGLGGVDNNDFLKEATNVVISKPRYREADGSAFVNGIFDDVMIFNEFSDNVDTYKDKYYNASCEKAIIDAETNFLMVDNIVNESAFLENPIVDTVLLESATVYEEAPKTIEDQIMILNKRSEYLESVMNEITKKFEESSDEVMEWGEVLQKVHGMKNPEIADRFMDPKSYPQKGSHYPR